MKRFFATCACIAAFNLAAFAQQTQHGGHGMAHEGAEHHHHGTHFDDAAKWSKRFDDPARDAWQMPHRIMMALKLKETDIVADIGAGTGYLAVRLAHHTGKGKVYASDISKSMVEFLTKRASSQGLANLAAVQGSVASPNLPEMVDAAVLLDVYHHIGNRVDYFRNLKASLKPGARVIIIDFRPEAKLGAPKHMRLPVAQVDEELSAAGYKRIAAHDFLPHQYFLEYQAR